MRPEPDVDKPKEAERAGADDGEGGKGLDGGIFDSVEANESTDDRRGNGDGEASKSDIPNNSPENEGFNGDTLYRSPKYKKQDEEPDDISDKSGQRGDFDDFLFMIEAHDVIGVDEREKTEEQGSSKGFVSKLIAGDENSDDG